MSLSRDLHVYLTNKAMCELKFCVVDKPEDCIVNKVLHVELYFYDLIKAPLVRAMKRIKRE